MVMIFYCIKDHVTQKLIITLWELVQIILVQYPIKQHAGKHHQAVWSYYTYMPNTNPSNVPSASPTDL